MPRPRFISIPQFHSSIVHALNVLLLGNIVLLAIVTDAAQQPWYVQVIVVLDFVLYGVFVLEMCVVMYVTGWFRFYKAGRNRCVFCDVCVGV